MIYQNSVSVRKKIPLLDNFFNTKAFNGTL